MIVGGCGGGGGCRLLLWLLSKTQDNSPSDHIFRTLSFACPHISKNEESMEECIVTLVLKDNVGGIRNDFQLLYTVYVPVVEPSPSVFDLYIEKQ